MKKEIICTVCPKGCHITVTGEGNIPELVEGYTCSRGLTYASDEFSHPVRILTTTVKVAGTADELLPVRSAQPLPKEKLLDCMAILRKADVKKPVAQYDVVVPDICGTGINIVAVKAID